MRPTRNRECEALSRMTTHLRGGKKALPWKIDEATYFQYLDHLPPRYMNGNLFAFGEGASNFTLFWVEDRRYFAHQLSADDTETFCRLNRVSLHV